MGNFFIYGWNILKVTVRVSRNIKYICEEKRKENIKMDF
jgi:hypothetical protein